MSRPPGEALGRRTKHRPLLWNPAHKLAPAPSRQLRPQQSSRQSLLQDPSLLLDVIHNPSHIMPTSIQPVAILPQPQPVFRSQRLRPCEACGKISCTLTSHKNFTQETISGRRTMKIDPVLVRSSEHALQSLAPPLAQYPIAMDAESHRLLALWSQKWGYNIRMPQRHLSPVRWIDGVLPAAMRHAPLFQSLLATSASVWALETPSAHEIAAKHMSTALRLLSASARGTRPATDEFILGSICILLVFLVRGDGLEVKKQFLDITRWVSSRGGPHYLGLSGIVAEILLYADSLAAVFCDQEPVFTMPLPPLKVGVPPRLGMSFRNLAPTDDVALDVLSAADSLCRTADIFELSLETRSTYSGIMNSFGYLSSISEYQLARCYHNFKGSSSWNEVICLALLLFDTAVIHSHGSLDAVMQRIEHLFWNAVDRVLASRGLEMLSPHLIIWVLLTGLTTSIYTPSHYRARGIAKIRLAKTGVSLNGWNDFRVRVLDQHLWMKAAQEAAFHDIWLEVEGRKLALPTQAKSSP